MIEHTRLMERILKRLIGRKRAHRLSRSQAQTSQVLKVQTSAQIFNHIRQREHLLAAQLELGSGGETERNVRANLHRHVGLVLAELAQHVDASRESLVQVFEATLATKLFGVQARAFDGLVGEFGRVREQLVLLREELLVSRLHEDRFDEHRVAGVFVGL